MVAVQEEFLDAGLRRTGDLHVGMRIAGVVAGIDRAVACIDLDVGPGIKRDGGGLPAAGVAFRTRAPSGP